eukprot:UN24542
MLRKRFGPIWVYIKRFYENEKNRIFSNFTSFLKPHVVWALRFPH